MDKLMQPIINTLYDYCIGTTVCVMSSPMCKLYH